MYTKDSNNSNSNSTSNQQSAQDKAHGLADNLKEKASGFKNQAEKTAGTLKNSVGDLKDKTAEALYNSYSSMKEKATDAEEDVIEYVKSNPVKAISLALATGFLLTLIKRK